MNEQLDAILTAYEDLWWKAALAGRPQFTADVRVGECAMTIGSTSLMTEAQDHALTWRCPECWSEEPCLSSVAIHLNDDHGWTWDRFANKFRDALEQGTAK